jgi:hypothetical protein
MDTQELRDSRKTPPCVHSDTGRGALYELRDMAMPGAPSLFYSVHEAAEPLSGGISTSLGRRHLPLHSRRPCPRGSDHLLASGAGPLGLNFSDRRSSQVGSLR